MDKFVPDIYQKSVFVIDYEKLIKNGIKCVLFDLDNTLAPISCNEPDKKIKDLMEEIKELGIKPIIISNSDKTRVAPFKDQLNIDAAASSKKPLKGKYLKIMKMYGFKESEVAAVGDQLLTDVLGANRVGITSILVNPISINDLKITKINRKIEKILYKRMAKKGLFEKGVYYD